MGDERDHEGTIPPLRAHGIPRRVPLAQRLRAITRDWRATADSWKRDNAAASAMRPPQPSTAAIANWINWLNACAKQIDDELDDEELSK